MLQYHPEFKEFKVDYEMKRGMYDCLERLVETLVR